MVFVILTYIIAHTAHTFNLLHVVYEQVAGGRGGGGEVVALLRGIHGGLPAWLVLVKVPLVLWKWKESLIIWW